MEMITVACARVQRHGDQRRAPNTMLCDQQPIAQAAVLGSPAKISSASARSTMPLASLQPSGR